MLVQCWRQISQRQCLSKGFTMSWSKTPHTKEMCLECNGATSIRISRTATADFDGAFNEQGLNARLKRKESKKNRTWWHESFSIKSLPIQSAAFWYAASVFGDYHGFKQIWWDFTIEPSEPRILHLQTRKKTTILICVPMKQPSRCQGCLVPEGNTIKFGRTSIVRLPLMVDIWNSTTAAIPVSGSLYKFSSESVTAAATHPFTSKP